MTAQLCVSINYCPERICAGRGNEENLKFEELNVDEKILKAIGDMGFEEASPIQAKAIPVVLEGKDIVGQAQTGTGKTAAYGIPMLQSIDPKLKCVQAVVLCPTRELAIQVADEIRKLAKYMSSIKVLPVYGGQEIVRQIKSLKTGVQIVVGTPGRVMDHMRRKTVKFDKVKMVILDEADEMLDMGFREDMETILTQMPEERQTVMFSATMPKAIMDIARTFQNDAEVIKVVRKELTVENIEQYYFEVRSKNKDEILSRLIDIYNPKLSVVFCNTKKQVDDLISELKGRGYFADGIHGDMKQAQRDRVMNDFRKGKTEILIATDVAARGIDVDDVDIVFNYDLPQDEEYYVHRIGRTGRAGNTGVAMTFITPREFRQLKLIERTVKTKIQRRQLPTAANVIERQRDQIISKMQTVLELNAYHDYMPIAESLLDDYSAEEVAAAALKLMQEGIKALEAPQEDILSKDLRNTGGRPGMVRLFINIGRSQKIMVKDIVSTIAIEADIPARDIGLINIYDKFTFVEVPEDVAEKVIGAMNKNFIKGYKVNIEPAKARR